MSVGWLVPDSIADEVKSGRGEGVGGGSRTSRRSQAHANA